MSVIGSLMHDDEPLMGISKCISGETEDVPVDVSLLYLTHLNSSFLLPTRSSTYSAELTLVIFVISHQFSHFFVSLVFFKNTESTLSRLKFHRIKSGNRKVFVCVYAVNIYKKFSEEYVAVTTFYPFSDPSKLSNHDRIQRFCILIRFNSRS